MAMIGKEEEVHDDPDDIAAKPPEQAVDPKLFFQVGEHEGKWIEYDERGVPLKNIKKKKPSKKEKDVLESEFLEAKKTYQQYLKDLEAWEQAKVEAEAALERSDRLRWAFRQVGDSEEKQAPILVDALEDMFRILGWDDMSKRELGSVKTKAAELAEDGERLDLEVIRHFTNEQMPTLLLEERLKSDVLDRISLEDIYSPRAWRDRLEGVKKDSKKKSKKDGKSSPRSPRASGGGSMAASPRGSKSPKKKRDSTGDESPRSPRSGKEKKEKKSSK